MKVEEKIEKMLTDGGAMFVHFNTTNVATKSKEEMTRLVAKTIAQKLKDVEYPLIYAGVGSRVVNAG